jgi:UDP-N-acetylmuramyl pentapeptide phosphotransferase/UDP-N-acetylglucosamine-1-phosphate transferase
MASAAVGGVLSVAWFFALPALIFSIASTLGFLWRNDNPSRPTGA